MPIYPVGIRRVNGNKALKQQAVSRYGGDMFKKCNACGEQWQERENFLCDDGLQLIGYQVDFENLQNGLLLFNHTCGTTLAIPVWKFLDLCAGPEYSEAATGSEECPRHCLDVHNLDRCTAPCVFAHVREIMQIIMAHQRLRDLAPIQ